VETEPSTAPGRSTLSFVQASLLGDAVEYSRHAVFVTGEDGELTVAVNDAACTLLGYTREELLRIPARALADRTPDEMDEIYRAMRTARQRPLRRTARWRRKDGSVVEIGYWGTWTTVGGIGYLLTLTDPVETATEAS
jgi:PAS domain S-box-containing protein